jgi:NAD(P)-dependent dehydrogenase (short-subunit alcohol dehydrogenase family)
MTQSDPEFRKVLGPAIDIAPMKRMGTAQEIADACLFLCSSKASFVQGHAMVSDYSLKQVRLSQLTVCVGCGRWICD